MEQYTDDERVENLKAWWKENGASIGVGITLGVIVLFGWRYWGDYRNAGLEQASRTYDAFIEAAGKPDASQRGQAVLTDFPQSPYAVLAALRLAKLALDSGDTTTAIQRLEWVISNAKLDELKDIARLRLARVRWATGQIDHAHQLLDSVTTVTLNAERDELKGDLYLVSNEVAKAKSAYAAALAASGGNRLLQLKLEHLAAPTADALLVSAPAPLPEPVKSETAATAPTRSAEPAPESAPVAELVPVSKAVPVAELAPAKELEPIPAVEPVPVVEPVAPVVEPAPVTESTPVPPNPSAEPATDPAANPDGAVPAAPPIPATSGQ